MPRKALRPASTFGPNTAMPPAGSSNMPPGKSVTPGIERALAAARMTVQEQKRLSSVTSTASTKPAREAANVIPLK
jgi:hypothetical protein